MPGSGHIHFVQTLLKSRDSFVLLWEKEILDGRKRLFYTSSRSYRLGFNGGTNFCSTCLMFMGDGGSNAFPLSILCEVVNSQLLWKIETAEIH